MHSVKVITPALTFSPVGVDGRVSKRRGGALTSRCSVGLDNLSRPAEVRNSGNPAIRLSKAEEADAAGQAIADQPFLVCCSLMFMRGQMQPSR